MSDYGHHDPNTGGVCSTFGCWCKPKSSPPSIDPRDARVAELEAQLVNATEKGLELAKLLDPAVVWAATQLKANADAHPGGCCVKCRAAVAALARLESK